MFYSKSIEPGGSDSMILRKNSQQLLYSRLQQMIQIKISQEERPRGRGSGENKSETPLTLTPVESYRQSSILPRTTRGKYCQPGKLTRAAAQERRTRRHAVPTRWAQFLRVQSPAPPEAKLMHWPKVPTTSNAVSINCLTREGEGERVEEKAKEG